MLQTKQQVAETAWLKYYNSVLFENGLISETVRNRMVVAIESRKVIAASATSPLAPILPKK